jgi:DNA end-binding protein Ku
MKKTRHPSIWKGTISFGLLNIPIALQTAEQDKELHFSMLDRRDMSPIKFKRVNEKTGREVPHEDIAKAYQIKKGDYVLVEEKDFLKANPKATQTVDIEDFVALNEIDPLLFDKPYYIVPQKDAEKGYFLLRDALAKTKQVAIAKIVLRTKQHLVAIMPRGEYLVLEMLRFSHQVLEENEAQYLKGIRRGKQYSQRELKMAMDVIESMSSPWTPDKYKDTYYSDLIKRIQSKAKQGSEFIEETGEEEKRPEPTTPEDLVPLLKESLQRKRPRARAHAQSKMTH